uniref:Platelet-derived growth factor subunit B n=1 Tax=Zonotrichia albicollis TaxID=44394 RepID=A0A8D2MI94_ZONAL
SPQGFKASTRQRTSLHFTGSVVFPVLDSLLLLHDTARLADHLSNACFSPSFVFVVWQGDPIPEDIYEILGGSSVHSISDLQRALRIDSVEQDSSSLSLNASQPDQSPVALSRERRSLDALAAAETAVLAECKTREVVFEISRAMVDSTNANFVVWPPCVEVQRCSGCCNNRNVQCRPTQIRVRPVQVNKIEFVQRKPKFTKVIVPLEDHVQCRCEAVFRPPPRNIRPGPREQRRKDLGIAE